MKKLINDERCQRPLLVDIWQFHQVEKLYILRVIKEILTRLSSAHPSEKHYGTFQQIFAKLNKGGALKRSLKEQLKDLIESPMPEKDRYHTNELLKTWKHFNLRQQCELLQIHLLFFHHQGKIESEDVTAMLDIFVQHRFGIQQSNDIADQNLVDSIGQLESILTLYLLDLGSLTLASSSNSDAGTDGGDADQVLQDHSIWKDSRLVQSLDKILASHLGNLRPHGPPMLGWMVSHYLVDKSQANKFKNLGERAFQLDVMEYLSQTLKSDACNANAILSSICYGTVYSLLSILVTAFDPSRMKLQELAIDILQEKVISNILWKEGFDCSATGLSGYIGYQLTETPIDSIQTIKILQHLAKHNPEEVIHFIKDRSTFVEAMESVPTHFIDLKGPNQVVNVSARHKAGVALPAGLIGTISQDNKYFLWSTSYSGFKPLLYPFEVLVHQVTDGGARNVSKAMLASVTEVLDLFDNFKSDLKLLALVKPYCLSLLEKFIHVPNPPIQLLSGSLRCLRAMKDSNVWKTLSDVGLFPTLTAQKTLHPGVLGTLLVQQECVLGYYPLTKEFLKILLAYPDFFNASSIPVVPAFVAEEILPSYQNWRFNLPLEKEQFGQLVLQVCLKYQDRLMESLAKSMPNQTLINIVSMGDRTIQSCYEAQTTSEKGLGVELAKLVHLSLEVLNIMLQKQQEVSKSSSTAAGMGTSGTLLGKVISSSEQPHFLLTVAHYIYHLQSPRLVLTSLGFLSSVSSLFPMSLLACLGQDAEALRDILIHRLESKTEATELKLAILKFFTACVKSQPGLIQLLLSDANHLLESVMDLLKNLQLDDERSSSPSSEVDDLLHLYLIEFIYSLWSHDCSLAVTKLKQSTDFWTIISKPLFKNNKKGVGYHQLNSKVNGFILRIISSEIFLLKQDQLDKALVTILETRFFDENYMTKWCDLMLDTCSHCDDGDANVDVTAVLGKDWIIKNEDVATFLLGSWKTFLIVLSKEQPFPLSPSICHLITDSFIKTIRVQLVAIEGINNIKIVISLSETCLVLMQRWLTKCSGDSMTAFVENVGAMLQEFAGVYEMLHPRARVAVQGIFATTLKLSAFKMEMESSVMSQWLLSACQLVEKALQSHQDPKEAILAVGLLRSLLQRRSKLDLVEYYTILHQRSILMILLSYTHHALLNNTGCQVIHSTFGLFLTLSKDEEGVGSLLAMELSQLLWLPLSNINRKLDKDWIQVFNLALQLALHILRRGKQHALEHILTVIALLQEQLSAFLSGPKNGNIEKSKMELTATSATLISHTMTYYKQWQMIHPASLNQFYYAMNSLLHTCACLLVRPSLLNMMVNQKNQQENEAKMMEDLQRVRRLSSCDYPSEMDSLHCPETIHIQNRILDTVSSCLKMLIALSPDLITLITDDIIDHAAYEQLLQIGFSTPAFEQVSTCHLEMRFFLKGLSFFCF